MALSDNTCTTGALGYKLVNACLLGLHGTRVLPHIALKSHMHSAAIYTSHTSSSLKVAMVTIQINSYTNTNGK